MHEAEESIDKTEIKRGGRGGEEEEECVGGSVIGAVLLKVVDQGGCAPKMREAQTCLSAKRLKGHFKRL